MKGKIQIPGLSRRIWEKTGNKNKISQSLSLAKRIDYEIIDSGRSHIELKSDTENYYLTCNKNDKLLDKEYILLTDKKPTYERIKSKEIKFKRWLKHPKSLNRSPQDVLDSWKGCFNFIEENLDDGINGLRIPQIGALYSILGHLKVSDEIGTVVMPTGTGKTETMISVLVSQKCQRLLITVPTDPLRDQLFEKIKSFGLLKDFGIISETALCPIVGKLKQKFNSIDELEEFFLKCNVVVSTMNIVSQSEITHQEKISELCSHLFIDEAHHAPSKTWESFRNRFKPGKVIQFTATPFRNDGKRIKGKVISNFSLRNAQEQGYFTKIDFIPIKEYDPEKAHIKIADIAVKRLREDIANGFEHILMARCESKIKAEEIFKLYEKHSDLNPVLIHSSISRKQDIYNRILKKEAKIIICVDMLGEGFDLPELKVAAFHDIRKSLPITLQFAGRFTRTKFDKNLGNASFIANIADLKVKDELEDLYSHDSDWNILLSDISHSKIEDEENYKKLISGFSKLKESNIPFQNIKPKLSTVVYQNKTDSWFPKNFKKGVPGYDNLEYSFYDINSEEKILVIIVAKRQEVDWVNHKEIYDLKWDIIIVFWETKNNLLFINSTDNSILYEELAHAIIGDKAKIIDKIDVFKGFYNIHRTRLQNVGLRLFLGKNIRFRMSVGSDVAEALSIAEKQKGEKAFAIGVGYENGEQVNIGCSYKGRIWTKLTGDLGEFKTWCFKLGEKLSNDKIDPNQILRETLIPELISQRPKIFPVWIDWCVDMYLFPETKYTFFIDGISYNLSACQLEIEDPNEEGELNFCLSTDKQKLKYCLTLFLNTDDPENKFPDFEITAHHKNNVEVTYGRKKVSDTYFFQKFIPTIWFADGSALTGNEYVELKQSIVPYPKDRVVSWDWTDVDLSKESQGISPKITDSIQYFVIQKLKENDYDIIYDDDGKGEIADILTIKNESGFIQMELYHLKFAEEGKVSGRIKNLYEVCGQAQKSIHWKHKGGRELLEHLLRREKKTRKEESCSRIEVGTIEELDRLLRMAKKKIPIIYEVFIVQPGFSKSRASAEILTLLGVTENYLKEIGGIDLNVISSE